MTMSSSHTSTRWVLTLAAIAAHCLSTSAVPNSNLINADFTVSEPDQLPPALVVANGHPDVQTAERDASTAALKALHAVNAEAKAQEQENESSIQSDRERQRQGTKDAATMNEDSNKSDSKVAAAFLICLLVLIMGTIGFEHLKGLIYWSVKHSRFEVMVEAMFAELTVLGFIGLLTFVMGKSGVLKSVSETVFDISGTTAHEQKENEEKVPEIFETLHMMLFVVMCFFVVEVMLGLLVARSQQNQWTRVENIVQDDHSKLELLEMWEEQDAGLEPSKMAKHDIAQSDFAYALDYLALRLEFVSPREKVEQKASLGDDFDFSDYLGTAMAIVLAEIVEVSTSMWLTICFIVCIVYALLISIAIDMKVLAICIVSLMYIIAATMTVFRLQMIRIRRQLVSRTKLRRNLDAVRENFTVTEAHTYRTPHGSTRHTPEGSAQHTPHSSTPHTPRAHTPRAHTPRGSPSHASAGQGSSSAVLIEDDSVGITINEETPVLEGKGDVKSSAKESPGSKEDELPYFLTEANKPLTKRNCLSKYILGDPPNKHYALFWFDNIGPGCCQSLLQLVLVMLAVYFPALTLIFYHDDFRGTSVEVWFAIGIGLCAPVFYIYYQAVASFGDFILVTHVEKMIDSNLVQRCRLAQRHAKVMNILSVINQLRVRAKMVESSKIMDVDADLLDEKVEALPTSRKAEISEIFENFDTDQSGALDLDELQRFLKSLGKAHDRETTQNLMELLDKDANGVSKQEFLRWMVLTSEDVSPPATVEEAAAEMFALFDVDGDGNVSREEFCGKLEEFGMKLRPDEENLILREIDQDQTGEIDIHDFIDLMERHSGMMGL